MIWDCFLFAANLNISFLLDGSETGVQILHSLALEEFFFNLNFRIPLWIFLKSDDTRHK